MVARPADIDDVAQETFLVARRRLDQFQGGNAAGWLYRIAQHVTRGHRRGAWLRRLLQRAPELAAAQASQQTPVEALDRREARRQMHHLLSQIRRLPDFDHQNVAGSLYQITRRRMRDYRRLSWIRLVFTERTPTTFPHLVATGLDPLKQLEGREKAALLGGILDTLPGEQRAAFMLFEIEGYSGAEVAQLQQVALNTVWGRIYQARQKLQSRLRGLEQRASQKR